MAALSSFSKRLLPLCLSLTLAGCGMQGQSEQTVAGLPGTEDTSVGSRPFPADTLYALLVAEVASNRGQLDIALANYYQQAYKTRDIGVTRRATLLAQYLHAAQAALDLATLWSELEPQNPEPVYLAGQYLIAMQRLDVAMQQSRKLLDMDAQTLFVAIATTAKSQPDTVRQQLHSDYDQLLAQHPKHIDLLLGYAVLQEQEDDFDGSLHSIHAAMDQDRKDLQARLFEVELLYKSGRPDKAIRQMAAIVADDKDNERLRLQYARMLADQDLEKAREQFDYLANTRSMDPDLLLARSLINYKLNDRVQAQDQFEQLLFLHKHEGTANYYLGEMALAGNEPAKALEFYRRVDTGGEYLPAVVRTFDLMVTQSQRLDGQKWMLEQRQKHPELAIRLYLIEADILLQHGDLSRSLAALNEAVQRNPDKIELYYARSLLHEKLADNAAAEADLRFVLQVQPDNVDALNALGYVLIAGANRLEEAHRLIARALALRPEDPAIMDSMGWVLYHMGKHEEAVLRLKRAFELYPNDEVAAHLGEALWSVNKKTEADAIWKQGMKIKPDSKLIPATRKRLQTP